MLPYRSDALALLRGHVLAGRRAVRLTKTPDFDYAGLHNRKRHQPSAAAGRGPKLRIHVASYDALAYRVAAAWVSM